MKIELVDLKKEYRTIKDEIDHAIFEVIQKGNFIFGEELELFEKEFSQYCQTKFAVGVDSGTGALELALRAFDIKEKDEVIVPVFTFYATPAAVCYAGAKPVFIDVQENTGNIDVQKIEECIELRNKTSKSKMKAIIPVHLFGQPCNMNRILEIAKKYNLKIIEDAAQSHGAEIKINKKSCIAGSLGDVGCFSFYPAKNLGCYGDGGAIITSNDEVVQEIKLLRDYGRTGKYVHSIIGYNKRLDTIQANILRIKLKKLDKWNKRRREIAKKYDELFKNIEEIRPLQTIDSVKPVYHMYVIKVKERDKLRSFLTEKNIMTGIHYPVSLHLQPAFRFLGYKKGEFPVAEKLSREVLSIPMYPELKNEEVEFVAKTIIDFLKT